MPLVITPPFKRKINTVYYKPIVLADGPIVYYDFDEVTGNAIDQSGNGNTGWVSGALVQGAVPLMKDSSTGGTAYTFNGPAGAAVVDIKNVLTDYQVFSLEAWINVTAFPAAGTTGHIISHSMFYAQSIEDFPASLSVSAEGSIDLQLSKGDNFTPDLVLQVPISINYTYHVVVTWDGTTANMYLNGVLANSLASPMVLSYYGGSWTIGRASVEYSGGIGNSYFDGTIDEPAIYDTILTPVKVKTHYEAGRGARLTYYNTVMDDSPNAYWRLGEQSGTTFVDEIGNYPGTSTGTPTLGVTGADSSDTNTAIYFNGANDYITASANAIPATGNFSIEAWIKPTGTPLTTVGRGIDGNGAGWSILLSVSSTSAELNLVLTSGGAVAFPNTVSGSFNSDQYYHIVGVYVEGIGSYLYIDGVQKQFLAVTATILRTSGIGITIGNSNGTAVPGTIDEVATYNYALSPGQVLDHYISLVP